MGQPEKPVLMICEGGHGGGSVMQALSMAQHLNKDYTLGILTHVCCGLAKDLVQHENATFRKTIFGDYVGPIAITRKIGPMTLPTSMFFRIFLAAMVAIFRWRPNVICLNNHHYPHIPTALAAKLIGKLQRRKIKTVAFMRGTRNLYHVEKRTVRYLDLVIALSEAHSEFYIREGVPREKVKVILNGLDVDALVARIGTAAQKIDPAELSREPGEPVRVVLVGRYEVVKDHATALKALRLLLDKEVNVKFYFVGDGGERATIERTIEELGLDNNVVLTGFTSNVPEYLVKADIGLLCSVSEGMSNAIIEYLVAGLPVVATDLVGMNEVVVEGVNGSIAAIGDSTDLADKIQHLVEAEAARREYGVKSKELVQSGKFDKAKQIDRLKELFRLN